MQAPFYTVDDSQRFCEDRGPCKTSPLTICHYVWEKKSDYRKVFHEVLTRLSNEPSVQHTTIDYEKAMPEVLPNGKVKGCLYHWTQALWRKTPQTNWETHNISATAKGVKPKRRKRSIQETSASQQSIQVCLSLHHHLSIFSLLGLDSP
ncbi:hypothetical protein O3P69_015718 [Scylla paramamosain]|uniref:MULE transposase domain-containing protein n=1 Tax=Scylla paramamosain TaxID=85552 RepID=A0AAW0SAE7_SCYPA